MSQSQALIAEIQMEAANTRKILNAVPLDKSDWKPHPKSMALGRLASHVAEIPGWVVNTMTADVLDFANFDYKPAKPTTNEELVAVLDKHVGEAIAALENSKDEDFGKMWTMRNGEKVYFTLPKAAVVRSFALSHQYHHRAQLGVYLRLLDIPVPGMYGPTADEMPAPAATEAEAVLL
jgi:uncharacterized damage-inducible protein DinB